MIRDDTTVPAFTRKEIRLYKSRGAVEKDEIILLKYVETHG